MHIICRPILFSGSFLRIITYSILAQTDVAYVNTMHRSRNDTLNAVQLMFTRKFIPEMT